MNNLSGAPHFQHQFTQPCLRGNLISAATKPIHQKHTRFSQTNALLSCPCHLIDADRRDQQSLHWVQLPLSSRAGKLACDKQTSAKESRLPFEKPELRPPTGAKNQSTKQHLCARKLPQRNLFTPLLCCKETFHDINSFLNINFTGAGRESHTFSGEKNFSGEKKWPPERYAMAQSQNQHGTRKSPIHSHT